MAGRVSLGGREVEVAEAVEFLVEKFEAGASESARPSFSLLSNIGSFTGRAGEDITAFLDKLERAAELSKWSDAERLNILALRLDGDAAEYFRSREECRGARTYADLKKLLLERYTCKKSARFFREQLSLLRMDSREDVEAFADRVRKVNDRTYDASGSAEYVAAVRFEADQRALDAFLNGLPGELGRQCRLAAPASFEEAIRAAIRVREVERRPGDAPTARRVFRTPDGRACFNCGQTGHFMRDCRRGRRCFGCGQEGHLQKDCRRRRGPGGDQNLNGAGVGEAAESDPW